MSFKKNKYLVVKKAISPDLADFCYTYFLNKRRVAKFLFEEKYLHPYEEMFGVWNDQQVPNTYSHYGDMVMETLLMKLLPKMREITGLNLIPSYVKTIDNNPDAIKLITEISSKGIYKFL
tara:strand:- start:51 stop:410 length:360 start_codon:yes stop_codon:yes gene_type:complete